MKRVGKYIFYAACVLLWVIVVAAGFEMWTRYRVGLLENNNPFILSRTQGAAWPVPEEESDLFSAWLLNDELRLRYLGPGKSVHSLPTPSRAWEMQNRIPFFLTYTEWERQVFANVYQMQVVLTDRSGQIGEGYSVDTHDDALTLAALYGEDASRVQRTVEAVVKGNTSYLYTAPRHEPEEQRFGYWVVAASDSAHAWVLHRKPGQDAVQNDLWDIPFFTYNKQVRRREHINVLQLTEDFYVNNYGYRDADIHVPKPSNTVRVLCVGASTTEEGPTNELTYPAILEAMVNRRLGARRVDVVNAGVSGMNSLKHRMKLADYLALEPDAVIVYNAVNDICHDLFPHWVSAVMPWQERLRESHFLNKYFNRWLLPPVHEMAAAIEANKIADIRYLIEQFTERGIKVFICSFAAPDQARLSREEREYYEYYTRLEWGGRYVSFDAYLRVLSVYNEALYRVTEETPAIYVPVAERLRGGADLFGDICHLRNAGVEQKASIIADVLLPLFEMDGP